MFTGDNDTGNKLINGGNDTSDPQVATISAWLHFKTKILSKKSFSE
jgi:hypothetical protein